MVRWFESWKSKSDTIAKFGKWGQQAQDSDLISLFYEIVYASLKTEQNNNDLLAIPSFKEKGKKFLVIFLIHI